jgi:arylsulfatase A-like enzyme
MNGFNSRSAARLFALVLLALVGIAVPASTQAAPARPNVVVILVDDLGWVDVGCYGSTFYKTPNIDRLAAHGMRFTDAYAAGPVCSPTRASLLTGKYPARLHLTDWLPGRQDRPSQRLLKPEIERHLPLEEVTIAEALKPAGYTSASIGKWHLGGRGFLPQDQGFDVNIAGDESGSPLSYFAPFRSGAHVMAGLEESKDGDYLTDRLTDEAEKFIEANQAKPFFLYLTHYAVHIPLKAKEQLIQKYKALQTHGDQTNAVYAAMIDSVDQSVGRIVKKLDDLKLSARTVIIFASDNGGLTVVEGPDTPSTSNAPLREGKGYLYEGGIRVPLIVCWPGTVHEGVVEHTPVSTIDFFPTILAMAGLRSSSQLDGTNLLPVLTQTGSVGRDSLYWHYPHYSNQGGKPCGAIREGDFKLIQFYEDNRLELYNLNDDPIEIHNLAGTLAATAGALRTKLQLWRKSVDAQMMEPNSEYDGAGSNRDKTVPQMADGTILLRARDVTIHGSSVRYEPQPEKNTIGYWTNREDWVSWDFQVTEPGIYTVEVLQGCGTGSEGSEVEFCIENDKVTMVVQDTGGFQNFVRREIGKVRFDRTGHYTLDVKPKTKPGLAVMDLRSVVMHLLSTP